MASPAIRGSTVAADGLAATSPAGTQVGDCVIVFTWEQQATIPNHTTESGYELLITQGYDEGSTDGRLSVAAIIATAAGAQSYQAVTTDAGTPAPITGLLVLEAGTFETNFANWLVSTPFVTTTNANGNPPSVGLTVGKDWLVVSGVAFRATADTNFTPSTNYTEQWESAGSAARGNLQVQTRAMAGAGLEDPGNIGDTSAPSGTISYTIGIPESSGAPPVQLAAVVTGVSTIQAAVTVLKRLAAAVGATSTVSASLRAEKDLQASVGSVSTVAAALTIGTGGTPQQLAATIGSSSTVAASLRTGKPLQATVGSTSSVAADLRVSKRLAAVVAGVSTVAANLRVSKRLAAVVGAQSTVAADLRVAKRLAATIAAVSTMTVLLTAATVEEALDSLRMRVGFGR